jgi:hypothetical protein
MKMRYCKIRVMLSSILSLITKAKRTAVTEYVEESSDIHIGFHATGTLTSLE